MKNKKIITIFVFLIGILFVGIAIGASKENSELLRSKKFLYIFNINDKRTLSKRIERSGEYEISALISPKTESAKNRYSYPLEMKIEDYSPSLNISKDWQNLEIDTYRYPFFSLSYQSEKPLEINLYFYADFDNDGTSDFMVYYGKEPPETVSSKIKCYPMENFIEHNIESLDKSIEIRLHDELRLKRPDRISFILRKVSMEIMASEEIASYILKNVELYNEEPIDISIVLKKFEDTRKKGALETNESSPATDDLYGFLEETNELNKLLDSPLFELARNKYYISDLDREAINKILTEKTEVEFGRLFLKKDDRVALTPFENNYLILENVFLAEKLDEIITDPLLTFKRVNPTRYIVNVEAENSFWITLSENFHTGWKAYIVNDNANSTLGSEKSALQFALNSSGKLVPLEQHRVVNAFANGWFVPISEIFKGKGPYEFRIIMEFYPQRFYELGLSLSSIFFILMMIWLITYLLKSKVKKE